MIIKTKDIGLAGFVKLHTPLVKKEGRNTFVFESDDSIDAWHIKYYNDVCSKHDREVMILRDMARS